MIHYLLLGHEYRLSEAHLINHWLNMHGHPLRAIIIWHGWIALSPIKKFSHELIPSRLIQLRSRLCIRVNGSHLGYWRWHLNDIWGLKERLVSCHGIPLKLRYLILIENWLLNGHGIGSLVLNRILWVLLKKL